MTTRNAVSNTDLSESTWTSGAGIQKANALYDAVVDDKYIHYACGITQRVSGGNAIPHLAVTTQGLFDGCENFDTNNYSQMLASIHATWPGSANPLVENIVRGTAGGSIKEKHTHVLALELRDEDKHALSVGPSTTTSSTFQNEVTLTFTPATAGDYLIIADAQTKHASTSQSLEVQLDVDGTPYHLARVEPAGTAEWRPWSCVLGAISGETLGQFDATSHTLKIQSRSRDGSTTASIRQARIMCLRLDTFKTFYYKESLGRSINSTTTYATKLNHPPTIVNAGDHLVFMSAHIDGSTAFNTGGRLTSGGTTLLEPAVRSQRGSGQDDYACAMYRLENLSAGAKTWNVDFKKVASGIGVAGCEHAAICVIELAEAVTGRIVSLGQTVSRSKIAYTG